MDVRFTSVLAATLRTAAAPPCISIGVGVHDVGAQRALRKGLESARTHGLDVAKVAILRPAAVPVPVKRRGRGGGRRGRRRRGRRWRRRQRRGWWRRGRRWRWRQRQRWRSGVRAPAHAIVLMRAGRVAQAAVGYDRRNVSVLTTRARTLGLWARQAIVAIAHGKCTGALYCVHDGCARGTIVHVRADGGIEVGRHT